MWKREISPQVTLRCWYFCIRAKIGIDPAFGAVGSLSRNNGKTFYLESLRFQLHNLWATILSNLGVVVITQSIIAVHYIKFISCVAPMFANNGCSLCTVVFAALRFVIEQCAAMEACTMHDAIDNKIKTSNNYFMQQMKIPRLSRASEKWPGRERERVTRWKRAASESGMWRSAKLFTNAILARADRRIQLPDENVSHERADEFRARYPHSIRIDRILVRVRTSW